MTEAAALQRGRGRVDLLTHTYKPITNLEDLRAAAQLAIQVEFTTIPTYLTALYSISDRSSDAYQALRSVVVEEMFHANQAANILVGIGGVPKFTGDVVPAYPTYLPSASKTRTPYIGLFQASAAVFRNVFMAIETPAPFNAPPQDEGYSTIAQLYAALLQGIRTCVRNEGSASVFKPAPGMEQRTDIYLGKFGGTPIDVRSVETAEQAILQIVGQGEGAVGLTGTLQPAEPYGTYEHYGRRADGTYGPILGTPLEMSHFIKFQRVADAPDFPPTYPIVSNPRLSDFTNPVAITCAKAFNKAYSLMLRSLEKSFEARGQETDAFFRLTLPLMHEYLPNLAWVLMQEPVTPNGDGSVGPNAAPIWEWDGQCGLDEVIAALKDAATAAAAAGRTIPVLAAGAGPAAAPSTPAHTAMPAAPVLPASAHERLTEVIEGFQGLKAISDKAGLGL